MPSKMVTIAKKKDNWQDDRIWEICAERRRGRVAAQRRTTAQLLAPMMFVACGGRFTRTAANPLSLRSPIHPDIHRIYPSFPFADVLRRLSRLTARMINWSITPPDVIAAHRPRCRDRRVGRRKRLSCFPSPRSLFSRCTLRIPCILSIVHACNIYSCIGYATGITLAILLTGI